MKVTKNALLTLAAGLGLGLSSLSAQVKAAAGKLTPLQDDAISKSKEALDTLGQNRDIYSVFKDVYLNNRYVNARQSATQNKKPKDDFIYASDTDGLRSYVRNVTKVLGDKAYSYVVAGHYNIADKSHDGVELSVGENNNIKGLTVFKRVGDNSHSALNVLDSNDDVRHTMTFAPDASGTSLELVNEDISIKLPDNTEVRCMTIQHGGDGHDDYGFADIKKGDKFTSRLFHTNKPLDNRSVTKFMNNLDDLRVTTDPHVQEALAGCKTIAKKMTLGRK